MRTAADVLRDPRKDPKPGDITREGENTYEVIHRDFGQVCFIRRVAGEFKEYGSCLLREWLEETEDEVLHVAD